MSSFRHFCAILFLVKTLFDHPNSFVLTTPDHQHHQLFPSSNSMDGLKLLDRIAAVSEDSEEEQTEEGQGEAQEEGNGAGDDDPRRSESKQFFGMEMISDTTSTPFTSTVRATTTTIVGPTPPPPSLSKQRMQQNRHPFGRNIYYPSSYRISEKGVRLFASGRYEPPAQRPLMPPRMPSHRPDDPSHPFPQLSFPSSVDHQYAPLLSSPADRTAFAVPSSPTNFGEIAYYVPNAADEKYGLAVTEAAPYPMAASAEPKRPPVLLIGAFPPSANMGRSLLSPSPHFVSPYSRPNAPPPVVLPPPSVYHHPNSSSSYEFAIHSSLSPPPYQSHDNHHYHHQQQQQQHPSNVYANYYETSPFSTPFPSPSSVEPKLPHFSTLVSARPEFGVSSPPPIGRFIPGRPYQPSRNGGVITTTKTVPTKTVLTADCEQTDFLAPQSTEGPPKGTVPNRPIGKAHIICKERGVEFGLRTVFPFTGQIFAHDKKRIAGCSRAFDNEPHINITFTFSECGVPNQPQNRFFPSGAMAPEQFHLQIVVVFEQQNGTSTVQSYFVQCGQNRAQPAEKRAMLGRHIEEALEELQFVPVELEQKAPLPTPTMRFLSSADDRPTAMNGVELNEDDENRLQIGQSLVVQFALHPRTEAFGFLVKNCVVRDALSGVEHQVIDDFGCSTDLSIFTHPQYDTNLDFARAHWHAFKLPDQSRLSLRCRIVVCTDLDEPAEMPGGMGAPSSCAVLPSPPFCPDLVTSPSDSVLADLPPSPSPSPSSFSPLAGRRSRRLRRANAVVADRVGAVNNWTLAIGATTAELQVHASLCLGHPNGTQFGSAEEKRHDQTFDVGQRHKIALFWKLKTNLNFILDQIASAAAAADHPICGAPFGPLLLAVPSLFCLALLPLALAVNLFCRWFLRRREERKENLKKHLKNNDQTQ